MNNWSFDVESRTAYAPLVQQFLENLESQVRNSPILQEKFESDRRLDDAAVLRLVFSNGRGVRAEAISRAMQQVTDLEGSKLRVALKPVLTQLCRASSESSLRTCRDLLSRPSSDLPDSMKQALHALGVENGLRSVLFPPYRGLLNAVSNMVRGRKSTGPSTNGDEYLQDKDLLFSATELKPEDELKQIDPNSLFTQVARCLLSAALGGSQTDVSLLSEVLDLRQSDHTDHTDATPPPTETAGGSPVTVNMPPFTAEFCCFRNLVTKNDVDELQYNDISTIHIPKTSDQDDLLPDDVSQPLSLNGKKVQVSEDDSGIRLEFLGDAGTETEVPKDAKLHKAITTEFIDGTKIQISNSASDHPLFLRANDVVFMKLEAAHGQDGDGAGEGATGDGATVDGATGDGATGDGATGDGATGDGGTGEVGGERATYTVVKSINDPKAFDSLLQSKLEYGEARHIIGSNDPATSNTYPKFLKWQPLTFRAYTELDKDEDKDGDKDGGAEGYPEVAIDADKFVAACKVYNSGTVAYTENASSKYFRLQTSTGSRLTTDLNPLNYEAVENLPPDVPADNAAFLREFECYVDDKKVALEMDPSYVFRCVPHDASQTYQRVHVVDHVAADTDDIKLGKDLSSHDEINEHLKLLTAPLKAGEFRSLRLDKELCMTLGTQPDVSLTFSTPSGVYCLAHKASVVADPDGILQKTAGDRTEDSSATNSVDDLETQIQDLKTKYSGETTLIELLLLPRDMASGGFSELNEDQLRTNMKESHGEMSDCGLPKYTTNAAKVDALQAELDMRELFFSHSLIKARCLALQKMLDPNHTTAATNDADAALEQASTDLALNEGPECDMYDVESELKHAEAKEPSEKLGLLETFFSTQCKIETTIKEQLDRCNDKIKTMNSAILTELSTSTGNSGDSEFDASLQKWKAKFSSLQKNILSQHETNCSMNQAELVILKSLQGLQEASNADETTREVVEATNVRRPEATGEAILADQQKLLKDAYLNISKGTQEKIESIAEQNAGNVEFSTRLKKLQTISQQNDATRILAQAYMTEISNKERQHKLVEGNSETLLPSVDSNKMLNDAASREYSEIAEAFEMSNQNVLRELNKLEDSGLNTKDKTAFHKVTERLIRDTV